MLTNPVGVSSLALHASTIYLITCFINSSCNISIRMESSAFFFNTSGVNISHTIAYVTAYRRQNKDNMGHFTLHSPNEPLSCITIQRFAHYHWINKSETTDKALIDYKLSVFPLVNTLASPVLDQLSVISWEKLRQALFELVLLSLSRWYTAVMSIFSSAVTMLPQWNIVCLCDYNISKGMLSGCLLWSLEELIYVLSIFQLWKSK